MNASLTITELLTKNILRDQNLPKLQFCHLGYPLLQLELGHLGVPLLPILGALLRLWAQSAGVTEGTAALAPAA